MQYEVRLVWYQVLFVLGVKVTTMILGNAADLSKGIANLSASTVKMKITGGHKFEP